VIRFLGALAALIIDDVAQHLALARRRMAIKPNRMEFAQLRTKPSYPNDAKKISGNFFGVSQKTKTPLGRAAFISSER
jgi:hypothetical protein